MEEEYWRDTSSKEQRMRSGSRFFKDNDIERIPGQIQRHFSWKLWRLFLVNKHKIEEDTPNWCCRRTLLLNLLGRVIIRKYVTFLWRHLLPSKLNLSKRFIISALSHSGSLESSSHVADRYSQVHRKSCENRPWMRLKQDLTSDTFPLWITQKSKIERA